MTYEMRRSNQSEIQMQVRHANAIPKTRYGCVFCLTGHEDEVVHSLTSQNPGLKACSVSRIKCHTRDGVTAVVDQITLSGYVYFATEKTDPPDLRFIQDAIRLVYTTQFSWALSGMDEWFAKWVLDHGGLIGLSKATRVDNWVEFVSGPLFELKHYVKKVDKRHRGAQISLPFHDREVQMWLHYDEN